MTFSIAKEARAKRWYRWAIGLYAGIYGSTNMPIAKFGLVGSFSRE